MKVTELLAQCKSKKLQKVITDLHKSTVENGGVFYIYDDMLNVKFDVELDEDFGHNIMSYFEPTEVDEDEGFDGWQDNELNDKFANLLRGWKWNNVKLKNGNIVLITNDDCEENTYSAMLFNIDYLHDGAIEMRDFCPNIFYETV